MNTVLFIAGALLAVAAVATMLRMVLGPSTLDRLVALDTLVAVTMCAIGITEQLPTRGWTPCSDFSRKGGLSRFDM